MRRQTPLGGFTELACREMKLRLDALRDLLDFCDPRLPRSEVKSELDSKIQITIKQFSIGDPAPATDLPPSDRRSLSENDLLLAAEGLSNES
jgi:hypothetical protein